MQIGSVLKFTQAAVFQNRSTGHTNTKHNLGELDTFPTGTQAIDSPCECEHSNPDSLGARLFPSVVLAVAPAVTMDEASSLLQVGSVLKSTQAAVFQNEQELFKKDSKLRDHLHELGLCPQARNTYYKRSTGHTHTHRGKHTIDHRCV